MLPSERQLVRLSATARALALLAIGAPLLWSRDTEALLTLAAVGAILAAGLAVELQVQPAALAALVTQAAVVGVVGALAMPEALALLSTLVVVPLAAGLRLGARGVTLTLSGELVALVLTAWLDAGGFTRVQSLGVFTSTVTALSVGMIAAFVHGTLVRSADPLEPYRYAQSLIRELIGLSGGLRSGLDPQALGGEILGRVGDEVPTSGLTVFLPRDSGLSPLVSTRVGAGDGTPAAWEDVAGKALVEGQVVVTGNSFAFPLVTDGQSAVAVVAGSLSDGLDPDRLDLEQRIRKLLPRLEASAVQLDTALLFLAFRDAATADERRRLAREMHDGVAQDIVYLGYLVDALAAKPASPEQGELLRLLRERISAVVTEVRQSVETLRTSVGSAESLATAIGALARNLSEVSGIPIQVTADEHTTRLRPEVEAELFRITQEALNNAVKHAQATSIDVHCQVHAPGALITVTDNGRGLQQSRKDSHGLKIMRERANLVNADLNIESRPTGGLKVELRLPALQ